MEQMGTFMAEYAEWFYMGSSIVILILLIYVLHRIKKTERKNLMMNREIEKRLQQIEKQNRQKEYAEWFYMGSSIVILILLIYVLHRIKKTERKNLMMNREIEKRLQQIEKQNRQKETEDRTENEHEKMTGKIRLKEDTDLHQTQVLQGLEKGKQNAESVTVIHDVIEEVFS